MSLWNKRKQPQGKAEEVLVKISELLFPSLLLMKDKKGAFFHLDYSADSNLEAVLSDLQTGFNDLPTHRTVQSMIERLIKVRKLLGATSEIDDRATYFVVDDDPNDALSIEDRVIAEEDDPL